MPSAAAPPIPDLFPPALVQFVFAPDPFHKSDFPRNLSAREIEAFVRARIHPAVPTSAFDQLFLVVDHYDVHEVIPQLLTIAESQPSSRTPPAAVPASPAVPPAEARASIIKTAAIAGTPPHRARAAELFRGLSSETPLDDQSLSGRIVDTYESAALDLDAGPFSQRLAAGAASLARFETSLEPGDAEKRRRFGELDTLRLRLQRATKTANSKRSILAIPDRAQRVRVLIRAYLDLPIEHPGYLVDWAARRLRRETWAVQPPDQIERVFKLELRQELATAFRAVLSDIEKETVLEPVKLHQRVAALDAVQFFNGVLTEDEQKFLVSAGEGYVLPLSFRQVWPQP